MKYFKKLELPTFDLLSEFNRLISEEKISWSPIMAQISINSCINEEDNIYKGIGSLKRDWSNSIRKVDEHGNEYIYVPKIEMNKRLEETDFTELCTPFKNSKFEEIYNILKSKYNIGRVRIMKTSPKTCLSWHQDGQPRLHYPLKTQEGCYMVIDDEVVHMEKHTWWATNTIVKHSAFNGSMEDRIHLVVNILDDYGNII